MTSKPEDVIKITYIDDGFHNKRALSEGISLKQEMLLIAHFTTGADAIKSCAELKPDIMVIYEVPDMDRFDLLTELQSILLTTGFIMCTFSASQEFYEKSIQSGVNNFLSIPFYDHEQICNAIQSTFDFIRG